MFEVIRRCNALLMGGTADPDFIIVLGGPAAVRYFKDGQLDHQAYWLRVWGARGLLWAGPGDDITALRDALDDDHWRVRESACRVDPIKRVRTAASRAAVSIVESGS
jgi:hypothetical protein